MTTYTRKLILLATFCLFAQVATAKVIPVGEYEGGITAPTGTGKGQGTCGDGTDDYILTKDVVSNSYLYKKVDGQPAYRCKYKTFPKYIGDNGKPLVCYKCEDITGCPKEGWVTASDCPTPGFELDTSKGECQNAQGIRYYERCKCKDSWYVDETKLNTNLITITNNATNIKTWNNVKCYLKTAITCKSPGIKSSSQFIVKDGKPVLTGTANSVYKNQADGSLYCITNPKCNTLGGFYSSSEKPLCTTRDSVTAEGKVCYKVTGCSTEGACGTAPGDSSDYFVQSNVTYINTEGVLKTCPKVAGCNKKIIEESLYGPLYDIETGIEKSEKTKDSYTCYQYSCANGWTFNGFKSLSSPQSSLESEQTIGSVVYQVAKVFGNTDNGWKYLTCKKAVRCAVNGNPKYCDVSSNANYWIQDYYVEGDAPPSID